MSQKHRPNAFYNGVSSFKSAFPDVSDAVVEWRERRGPDDAKPGDTRKTGFRRGNFTEGVLPCSNPNCHEGGYEVDKLVATMLREGEAEREGIMLCSGREMGDEMRRGPIRCPHRIEYKAAISLRTAEDTEPERSRRRPQNRRARGRPQRRRDVA